MHFVRVCFPCAPWRFSPAVMTQAQNRLALSARELRHRDETSHPQSADVSERVVVTKSVMSVPVISSPWYDPRRTPWSHLVAKTLEPSTPRSDEQRLLKPWLLCQAPGMHLQSLDTQHSSRLEAHLFKTQSVANWQQ